MRTRRKLSIALITVNAVGFYLLMDLWLDPMRLSQNAYFMREFLAIFTNLYIFRKG